MRSERAHVLALLVISAIIFVPYAIAGPGFFIDDWFTLRNGAFDGWWQSAGTRQWAARPGAGVVYALTFGLIGQEPLPYFVLAATVLTVAALVLYRIASRFLPPVAAFGIASLWLLLPNHTSLEMWPSALNIAVALLLLLLGAERLTHPEATRVHDWLAAALFAMAVLTYEAVGPVAVAVVLLVAWRRPGVRRWQVLGPSAASLGATAIWMLLNWHPEKQGLDVWMDASQVVPAHFGSTIAIAPIAAVTISVSVLLTSAVLLYRRAVVPDVGDPWMVWTAALGWLLIVLGTVPFVRYFYAPIGLGDRVTVVSGVGGAMVLVAVVSALLRWRMAVGLALLLVVVSSAVVQRASMVSDYAVAADDSRRILSSTESRWPTPPDAELVFGPEPIVERNIVTFYEFTLPLQLLYGHPVDARLTWSAEDFEAAPEEFRVDLRPLSRLDDGRLGVP